jgi:hypothetical protein
MAIDAQMQPTTPAANPAEAAAPKEPRRIKISDILSDLENGLEREDIQKKYDLRPTDVTELFKHPKLKGKRAKKKVTRLIIIDDEEAGVISASTELPTAPAEELEN